MAVKQKYIIALVIFIIAIAFYHYFLSIRRSPWTIIQEDAPLCSGGKTAVSKSRVCYPPFIVPAAEWTEYAWDTGDSLLRRESIIGEIDKYLYEIGFIKQLNDVVGCVNDIDQRIAPYRFFIVNLEPTIVIMTDYDYGSIERKSNAELCGSLNDNYIHYSKYLVNVFHYGSSVPKCLNYKWFSPGYSNDIQDVEKDGASFIIKTKTATLVFDDIENNGWYIIARH